MSSKIKNFGKEALYKTGEVLSILTPFVPGDLQTKIAKHNPEPGEFGNYYYPAELTASDYTFWSALVELVGVGALLTTPIVHISGSESLAAGAYLAGDLAWRFKNYTKEKPSATAAIEISYRIGKKALQKVYKGKNKIPAVL